jgi:hypothetical protein
MLGARLRVEEQQRELLLIVARSWRRYGKQTAKVGSQ